MKRLRVIITFLLTTFLAMALISCEKSPSAGNSSSGSARVSKSSFEWVNPYAESYEADIGDDIGDDPVDSSEQHGDSSSDVIVEYCNFIFNRNDGSDKITLVKVEKGKTVSKPDDPTRTDYSFLGWFTDINGVTAYDFSKPVVQNTIIYAAWESSIVRVRFNYNYVGGPELYSVDITSGSNVDMPATPEREHYSFNGWYTSADASGEKFDFDRPVTENLMLYASWSLTEIVVRYDLNADGELAQMDNSVVALGETVSMPTVPEREMYDFVAWVDADDNVFDFSKAITLNDASGGVMTLKATWKIKEFTVTFDWNGYESGQPTEVKVVYGATVEEPTAERTGYILAWMLGETDYEFSTPITQSITLTASWERESSDSNTIVYYLNYADAPNNGVYGSETVLNGKKANQPSDPEREGYLFDGWFTNSACTDAFSFSVAVRDSYNLFAKWLKLYTFEAEYVDLSEVNGAGYSNEASGIDLIKKDKSGHMKASSGYYVTQMYVNDAAISFNIVSSADTDNAVIILRMQGEYLEDIYLNSDDFTISVNGEALDYDDITLHGETTDIQTDERREFADYEISRVSLNAGNNVITLTTSNTQDFDAMGFHFGTLSSYAPMVDCMKIYSDTELSWTPKTENITEWIKEYT